MSSVPKWLPEEGTRSSSSIRHPHEDVDADSNMTLETGQDSQAGKATFLKSHHMDKMHHVPISVTDPHTGHLAVGPESKLEYNDFKESRENKTYGRDAKIEAYHRGGKIDKHRKFQGRGDDTKEVKHDGVTYNDSKTHAKSEKECCGSESSLSNWKEHQKGKGYADGLGGIGNADWVDERMNLHGTTDVSKEYSTHTEREHMEVNQDTGENEVDPKGDDNKDKDRKRKQGIGENEVDPKGDDNKDKDRKRKQGKHHDWGQRDKGGDIDSLPFILGGNNYKELAREERESDWWKRDRKDVSKGKEGPKVGENDYINRDVPSAVEKEVSRSEKEIVDQSTMETVDLDKKKLRDVDGRRHAGKEARERRKERDGYVERETPEKRTRYADKESNGRGDDVDVVADKEKGSATCVAQQQKRVLHLSSSPQVANCEARFRHCGLEADRLQGKQEVATIVYKVGERMQELLRVWKEYESCQADKNRESCAGGPTLEIKIPGQHITATNRQVRGGQLWGTDVYTDHSDIVAVLMHTGYCRASRNPAPPALQDVRVIIRVLPPQDYYISSWRNNVRSRAWGAGIGCSYRVEQCFLVKKGCEPCEIERSLTYSSIEPTLAPIAVEHTMTTRVSNALRQQRLVKEVTIQYSLSNEPWIKYGINLVADKGLKKPTFTSARLKKGEVLYMETHFNRYELCFIREKVFKAGSTSQAPETGTEKSQNLLSLPGTGEIVDVFRFSRCKKILPQAIMLQNGMPLPVDLLEVLDDDLDWEDVLWSPTGVWIGGKEYQLARIQFVSPTLQVTSVV